VTASTNPLIDRDRLLSALGAEADRFSLDLRTQCDSSNTVLAAAPARDDGRVAVLVCDAQTAGRGRRGRTWLAWPGCSLTFSARWRFDADAPVPAGLSLVAGLSVVQALEALQVPSLELKWPNDIQIHGKKLGGILVELSRTGTHLDAVVGIGLNLRFPPDTGVPERTDVVALADVIDPLPPAEHMLAAILVRLQQLLDAYARSGFAPFGPGTSAMPMPICRWSCPARPSPWPASVSVSMTTAPCGCAPTRAYAACWPATFPCARRHEAAARRR